ncbi:phosphoenolpyruvate--protein phosphotransferase [Rhodoligotrophos defluvii]|uniref:phosphoenolpyruvate--protein phosphotransferase n=1 Tax=Rhodoligotrophos defluvii TaxID=2561934 RepID=UPI0010C96DAF|nr:phosphoenolpyruvate--protein phosphotransferase [Rhodoligotrophos defluvii]
MPVAAAGPRILLKRLREVMAEPENAQNRLNKIASLIASNMIAEVCSIYVMRPGGVLELYATEGLNPSAVHKSKLRIGEGLVGTIAAEARPLNVQDAYAHPAFKYLPETGEEIYKSFLGVPLLRSGLTLGVLVVQNRASRLYTEDEEEALQITAMVLAEVIASGEFDEIVAAVDADVTHVRSHRIVGDSLADGIALGHVVLHEPRVVVTNLIAEDMHAEMARLDRAIAALQEWIETMVQGLDVPRGEHREVLETYQMFAHDRGWLQRMRDAVRTGLTAEAAVERVHSDNRARMLRQKDPFLRERLNDLDDLANRLLRILTGQANTAASSELPKDAILVARNMGPAELLDYDRQKLRGVVLEEGGSTSHVAVVARALGVPLVGQAQGVLDIVDTGDAIIVDGSGGEVHIRPSPDIEHAYAEKVRFYARRQEQYRALRDMPAATLDGERIALHINAGLLVDLPHLTESGADGIGLFRTELQFMISSAFPRMDQQVAHYRSILEAAQEKPVVFRSLDIGADKVLPYLSQAKEENPALGWRAIRMALDRPALMKLQLRALLKAAGGRELSVMFPMVAEVDEFRRAREILEEQREYLLARGHQLPVRIRVGSMIEVPALVWQLNRLMELADFVSIGSNDLVQFLFACDRGHPRLAGRYDPLSPALLSVIREIVHAGATHGVPVNLCGEMAGRPLEAMALLGLGLRSISMAPAAIGPIKAMILKLHAGQLTEYMAPLLELPEHSLRPHLMAFARDSGIPI